MRHAALFGLCLVVLATSRCSCDDELGELVPAIAVTPSVIDMGRRVVGQSSEAGFLVGNEGTAAVSILEYRIEPLSDELAAEVGGEFFDKSGAAFSVVDGPMEVGARRSVEGHIGFLPTEQARYGGVLVIRSDDTERPVLRVPVVGEGGPPLIEADPASVDFGVVNEGPGASRIVRLQNVGYDVLHISDVRIEGPLADAGAEVVAFSLTDGQATAADVAVAASLSVEVRMNPTEAAVALAAGGRLSGTLVALSDAENEPRLEVPLVGDANLAPRAIAVELVTRRAQVKVGLGREVTIDGSETEDPEGDAFTFTWTLVEKPADSGAILLGNTVAGPCSVDDDCDTARGYRCAAGGTCKEIAWTRVTPDEVGTFVVRLRATDARGAYREADARILPRDLAIVLEWATAPGVACEAGESPQADGCCWAPQSSECLALTVPNRRQLCCGQTDIDLHLVRPDGTVGDYGTCPGGCTAQAPNDLCYEETDVNAATCRQLGSDCAYDNRYPEWFETGRDDDPRLDLDLVRGFGPEVITLNEPADGVYTALAHYFEDYDIGESVVATVKVYVKGQLEHTAGPQLLNQKCQLWIAGSLIRTGGPQDGSWSFASTPNLFDDANGAALCQ